ncbi:UvrD-helicase domain-containing protein [Campylobacter jejuni]|nr:UvrD-helicase domain-containing protein [Campylobacter jejuni]
MYFILKDFKNFCRNSSKLHEIINQQVVELWGLIESGQMPMCHDFYLKSYQLEVNKDLDRRYDVVMLDEAQDTNWVMLSIFLNNKCAKILVGDTFQNIYGFNETVNALEKIQSNFEFALNKSFRSTQNILDYADFFLAKFSNKQRKTMVSGVENKKHTIKNKAFITRTNSSIITFIDKLIKEKKNLEEYKLLKEPSSIFKPVFNIIYFRECKLEKLDKDFAFFKNFNNLEELEEYIDQTYDIELRLALELSKKNIDFCSLEKVAKRLYNNGNPEIVNYIINAHLSKGLEWDEIELQNDFPDLEGMEIELNQLLRIKKTREASNIESSLEQELNLFYVAITRAKYVLKDLSCNSMMISRIEKQKESNKTKI